MSLDNKTTTYEQWSQERAALLREEKEATKLLSSLAAKRRDLPLLEITEAAVPAFTTLDGEKSSLSDLFEGRDQLIFYHHMAFDQEGHACGGCTFFSDHVPHGQVLGHLQSRRTTFAAAAPASPELVGKWKARMGWTFPFYSIDRSLFKAPEALGWLPEPGPFKMSCFIKEGEKVFLSYSTQCRGVEPVLSTYALLDMTRLGRQDESGHFSYHDEY